MVSARPERLYLINGSGMRMLRISGSLLLIHPDIHRPGSFQPLVYKTLKDQWDFSNRSVNGNWKKQSYICYRKLYFHWTILTVV